MKLYFSDFFSISPDLIEKYGAFNISLVNDLPLFIDPFLLFNSDKKEYKKLHDEIIEYVTFLREISLTTNITDGLLRTWFMFPEVKQNWFGYSKTGNSGRGLAEKFAKSLNKNLNTIFNNFGKEKISNGSHLEKLCLIRDGVGRDNISDFTTNLIKKYLLEYTESFARKNINPNFLTEHTIRRVEFNYKTRTWVDRKFLLPTINDDFIILTPKDILTKDEIWINRFEMVGDFRAIVNTIPNNQLREQITQYFHKILPKNVKANSKEGSKSVEKTIEQFPEYIDYYIKHKENSSQKARFQSDVKVKEVENLFVKQLGLFVADLKKESDFYNEKFNNSLTESRQRLVYLKQVIEKNDGYKLFYVNGNPINSEEKLQLLFRLTWFATDYDVNREVNNGRGSVDYKVSKGAKDKMLVEFKLASNSQLKRNLKNQLPVYEAANQTKNSIKVILYFSDVELSKVNKIFKELKIKEGEDLILIDARKTNKKSASVC